MKIESKEKSLGLFALIGLIVSSIIWGSVFNLMSDTARDASAGATILGWL